MNSRKCEFYDFRRKYKVEELEEIVRSLNIPDLNFDSLVEKSTSFSGKFG